MKKYEPLTTELSERRLNAILHSPLDQNISQLTTINVSGYVITFPLHKDYWKSVTLKWTFETFVYKLNLKIFFSY